MNRGKFRETIRNWDNVERIDRAVYEILYYSRLLGSFYTAVDQPEIFSDEEIVRKERRELLELRKEVLEKILEILQIEYEEVQDAIKKLDLEIIEFVECIEPFMEGVNHYDTWIVKCADGMYRVASRHGTPYPNGPYPTEEISWDPWKVRGSGFKSLEEARKWWFEPEEVGAGV